MASKNILLVFGLLFPFIVQGQNIELKQNIEGLTQQIFETKDEALEKAGLDKYNNKENQLVFDSVENRVDVAKNNFGDSYAGSWIEYDENSKARHFIAVAGEVDAVKAKFFAVDGVTKLVSVKYSYSVL